MALLLLTNAVLFVGIAVISSPASAFVADGCYLSGTIDVNVGSTSFKMTGTNLILSGCETVPPVTGGTMKFAATFHGSWTACSGERASGKASAQWTGGEAGPSKLKLHGDDIFSGSGTQIYMKVTKGPFKGVGGALAIESTSMCQAGVTSFALGSDSVLLL
jgi:hypothetical protein